MRVNVYPDGQTSALISTARVFTRLPENATREDIQRAIRAEVVEALVEDPITFDIGDDDMIDAIRVMMEKAK